VQILTDYKDSSFFV